MTSSIVILGGGYAGAIAAARIAKRGIPVTLVDARAAFVERIRLHQVAAGDDIAPVPYRRIFRDLPVDVVRARVTGIDRERKRVLTTGGEVAYDQLVYALGSESVTPEHAVSVADPMAIRARVRDAKSVLIVGGGLTGIELASELAERHPHLGVAILDGGAVGAGLSERGSRHLRQWMADHQVTLMERTRVESVVEGGVVLASGRKVEADVVVWCGAFRLSPIAREAGLRVNERDQIVVDDRLRSSDPSIFAVGDAAACRDYRMSCALALPMGSYVADVLSGVTREPFRFGFAIQCISLGRNDGLIQFVGADDSPRERCVTGRAAAFVKELVCRYAALSLRLETRGFHYSWPKPEAA